MLLDKMSDMTLPGLHAVVINYSTIVSS